jgi:hypothetical protein
MSQQPQYAQPQYAQPQYAQQPGYAPQYGQQPPIAQPVNPVGAQVQPYIVPQQAVYAQPVHPNAAFGQQAQPVYPQQAQPAYGQQPQPGMHAGLLPAAKPQDGLGGQMPQEKGCRDAWAAGLFIINMGIMFYFAFTKGLKALEEESTDSSTGAPTPAPGQEAQLTDSEVKSIIYICVGVIFLALILSAAAINFMLSRGEGMIICSLWTQIVLKLICGALFFAAGLVFPALICFLLAGLVFCYMRCVQNRIRFAGANLKLACVAVNKHRSVIPVSYFMMILQFAWIVLMILAITGIQVSGCTV